MIKGKKAIEHIKPYIPGRPIDDVKKEYCLDDVIKLASNENPYGTSPFVKDAVISSLNEINYYPDGSCARLRNLVATKFNVLEDEVVFGAGSDELISLIALAFIEQDDEMITADFTFGQYKSAVEAVGGKSVVVPVKNFAYDLDGILSAITNKTKIIYIANPNNPSGTHFTDNNKIDFLNKVPKNVMIVLDEAYVEYVTDGTLTSSHALLKQFENIVVLKTFSKIYGLASLRVGYGLMHKQIASYLEKVRKPFNVSVMAQCAAEAALSDDDFLNKSKKNNKEVKEYFYKKLIELNLEFVKSETNFVLIDVKKDSIEVFEELMKLGFIVRPVGLKTHLRVTIGTYYQMVAFIDALKRVLSL